MTQPITPIDLLKVFAGDAAHYGSLEAKSSFETVRITEQLPLKARHLKVEAVRRVLEDLLHQKITFNDASRWAAFVFSHSLVEDTWDREHAIRDTIAQIKKVAEGTSAPLGTSDINDILQRLPNS